MKIRFTVHSYYEMDVESDDFDQVVKDVRADIDASVQKATRTAQKVDYVEELSERVTPS